MAKPSQVTGLGPRSRVSQAGSELVRARLADVRLYEKDLKSLPARGAVHNTRVSTRRLRSAIHLFGNRKLRQYEKGVKSIQDALGEVRDIQLQLLWLQSHSAGRREALRSLMNDRRRKLLASAKELRRRVSRWRGATAPALSKAIADIRSNGRLGGNPMRQRLKRKLAAVIPQLEAFDESTDPASIHRLRIALKKLRYDVELLEPAFPAYAGVALSVLVPLQAELGSVHDMDVRLELLSRFKKKATQHNRPQIKSLLDEVSETRREEMKSLARKIGWLVSEKIADRLRSLLD